jgi:hypothetical protein
MFMDRKVFILFVELIGTIPPLIESTNANAESLKSFYFALMSVPVLVSVNWPKAPKALSFVPVTKNFPLP